MEFPRSLIGYLKEAYPHVGPYDHEYFYQPAVKELFETHGIPAVRKALKELNLKRVPQFKKDYFGFYLPVIFLTDVIINGNKELLPESLRDTPTRWTSELVKIPNQWNEFVTTDQINFYSETEHSEPYSIFNWIQYGEECPECGTPFLNISRHRNPEGLCSVCRQLYNEVPLSYSSKAEDILGEVESKEVRYGIELEYEGVTARDVKKTLFKHAIAKRDGSIHDGVEVVTLPAPMKLHKDKLKKFFNEVKTQARTNTGMHVHIERSKLSEFQIGFIMEFMNRSELYPHLERIAGRDYDDNTYCRKDSSLTMTTGLRYTDKLYREADERYTPVNLTNRKTIEIRVFSSPESSLECNAKLEFVEGLVAYSSPYSVNVKQLKDKFKWEVFEDFMYKNKHHYPNFYAYYQGVI